MLKATWKDEKNKNIHFCVDDHSNDEQDWLLDVPIVASGVVSNDMTTTDKHLVGTRAILESDADLHMMTGFDRKAFGILYKNFVSTRKVIEITEIRRQALYALERKGKRGPRPTADVREDREKNVPLIHDDPLRGSNPGNRCVLDLVYVLLLNLIRKYRNFCQDYLAMMFGIDQAAVSRYIKFADRVLAMMLPTPYKF